MTPSSKTKTFFIKLLDSIAQIQPDLTNRKTSSAPHSHFLSIFIWASCGEKSLSMRETLDTNNLFSNVKKISCVRLALDFRGYWPKRFTKMLQFIFGKSLSQWLWQRPFAFISNLEHLISYPGAPISEKADTNLRYGWTLIKACCV